MKQTKKVALILKYLPIYRLAVLNQLSLSKNPFYEVIGDIEGREGIQTIPWKYNEILPENGGLNWSFSKSYYYSKSLQYYQGGVLSKIFSKDYDVFILDGAFTQITTWLFSILCRLRGKKIIFWTHGLQGTDTGIKKTMRKYFFKKIPHGLIVYGNYSKNVMINEGFNPETIFVIGNSLDNEKQLKIKLKFNKDIEILKGLKRKIFKNENNTLIFIGRLMSNKSVDKIIEVLYKLNKEGLSLNLIIIGGGEQKVNLKTRVTDLKLEGEVFFAGELYNEEEIAPYFLISDLMVSPGNVGLNCIHSLVYGVPVLTHDNFGFQNPEVEAILPDENGVFFKHKDFEDMKHQIKKWFSCSHPDLDEKCLKPIQNNFNPISHADKINNAVLKTLCI